MNLGGVSCARSTTGWPSWRNNRERITFDVFDEREKLGFLLAAYNGGFGALLKDRKLCEETSGCDPKRWFDNVEKHSLKSKKAAGSSKSPFEANRDYVTRILDVRKSKYESAFAKPQR